MPCCLGTVPTDEIRCLRQGVLSHWCATLVAERTSCFGACDTLSTGSTCEKPSSGIVYGIQAVDDINLHDLKDPKLWELWYIPYCG